MRDVPLPSPPTPLPMGKGSTAGRYSCQTLIPSTRQQKGEGDEKSHLKVYNSTKSRILDYLLLPKEEIP
ncbi:MAG: hypothetical protein Kow0088_24160 [Anaerolineales bacterium]